MAGDTRNIVITIKNGDGKPNPSPKPDEDKEKEPKVDPNVRLAKYAASQALGQLKVEATYFYGKYTQKTENYIAQNSVTAATSLINGVNSVISAIGVGSAILPGIGTAVGAVIGVAKLGIDTAKNYVSAYEDLDQKAYDKYYQGSRYGLINGNRGTDN